MISVWNMTWIFSFSFCEIHQYEPTWACVKVLLHIFVTLFRLSYDISPLPQMCNIPNLSARLDLLLTLRELPICMEDLTPVRLALQTPHMHLSVMFVSGCLGFSCLLPLFFTLLNYLQIGHIQNTPPILFFSDDTRKERHFWMHSLLLLSYDKQHVCICAFICIFVCALAFDLQLALHWWLWLTEEENEKFVCGKTISWTQVSQYAWRKSVLKLRKGGSWGTQLNEGGKNKEKE